MEPGNFGVHQREKEIKPACMGCPFYSARNKTEFESNA